MNFFRYSVFYYLLLAAAISTVDFAQVHRMREAWFGFLIKESNDAQKLKVEAMLHDYQSRM